MDARQVQLRGGEPPRAELRQVGGPQARKFVQQRAQRAIRVARLVPKAVVRLEPRIGRPGQDDPRSRNPVGLLPVDEVPDHVEWAERVGPFPASDPGLGGIG